MGTSRKSLQTSSRKKLEFTSSPGGNVNHPALSARGTRKEELEFLENLLSRQKRGANNEEEEISDEMSWQRRGFPSLRTKINERRELQQRTVPHLKPLKHRNVSAICDVAILSNFPTSQEYASNALAAFCCIKEDREFFLSAGGVQFTIDLLLKCKSSKGKSEACDALAQLLKNEGACKQFVKWKGTDSRTGEEFSSGLDLIFRMRGSKNAQLQRAGIEVCNVVLLSDALKHSERISPEFLRGLCSYCLAGDLKACTRAAQTLVSIFNRVLDTGIRWKVESLQPILELFKSFDMQPAVRTLVLRAMTVITKEGDTLCNLLSKIGCIKTLALQLSSRHNEGVPIDEDDINYLRSITQICETDQKRVEDVLIIGAVPRIISVFKEHLAPYDVQLSVELEVQRKCIRLFEKLASRPNTRSEFFDSGIVKLIIDILELENCSCKHLLHHMLVDISQDSQVQEKWSRMGAADIPRLIRHIKIENLELQTDVLALSLPPPPPHLPLRCSRPASSSAPAPTWCTSSGRPPSWSTSSTSSMLLASMRADRTCSRYWR
uniref:Uncharacterized protein n=2 Tax=Guillardia theta TaxID=55529 RepID=A0A7S4L3W0_GUITH|mmetsp:Transcript_36959/g.115949  ORF Transcript_36959/g.115949 Transcript_36959/m.115949 type:complete len:549 (+) Transcript_36959:279-1925(+)